MLVVDGRTSRATAFGLRVSAFSRATTSSADHLFLGTPQDNMLDKARKGRQKQLRKAVAMTNHEEAATPVDDYIVKHAAFLKHGKHCSGDGLLSEACDCGMRRMVYQQIYAATQPARPAETPTPAS